MDKWFNENYERLKTICKKISKLEDVDELYHFCIEQALKNKKFTTIENPEERVYFFSRLVRNNFFSKKSPYYQTYKRFQFVELTNNEFEIIDEEREIDEVDMSWIENELKDMKKGSDWYFARLFDLYIEENCSMTNLSKRTTIPINSVSRDIRKVKAYLVEKRDKQK